MAFRITLGQYWPTSSSIHALDPRTKVIVALAVMVLTFFVQNPAQLLLSWICMLAVVTATHVPPVHVLRSVAPVMAFVIVLGIANLLLVREGSILIEQGPVIITTGGVRAALLYPLRLVVAVVAAAVLLLTTTPTRLTDAFDAFLSPLSRIGLPGHELAMVISLMFRFIPTLADEALAIADAQATRGAMLNKGGPVRRVRAVIPILTALLAGVVRHASDLSRALDARCYAEGTQRSHWHPLRMRRADWIALALAMMYGTALILLGL